MEAVGIEARQRDGVARAHRVHAQALGHEPPVEVRADGQAHRCPPRVGGAGEVGHARQAHEQVARHVRRLGRERREPRPHLPAADEVLRCRRVRALRIDEAYGQHHDEVREHCEQYPEVPSAEFHGIRSLSLAPFFCPYATNSQ